MAFDSGELRDKFGKWVSSGSASQTISKAVNWVKSDEARAIVSRVITSERVKSAAVFTLQGAISAIMHATDPGIDKAIEYKVESLSRDLAVTKTHARQVMLTVVRSLLKARRGK